jgi:hypothetical protein
MFEFGTRGANGMVAEIPPIPCGRSVVSVFGRVSEGGARWCRSRLASGPCPSRYRNGMLARTLGWATTVSMTVAAVAMMVLLFGG